LLGKECYGIRKRKINKIRRIKKNRIEIGNIRS